MIRAAVVGLGWWGKVMVRRMKESDELKIVLAIDANPALEAFAREHGVAYAPRFEDALTNPDIDAVILCTPNTLHTEQVRAVAEAGKHVFCEKPLALTRAEAEASVAVCKKHGVMLGIGHERRYEPAMAEVRRLVAEGALGTIMHAEANFSHDKLANIPPGDWRTNPKSAPAAGMTAMGIHLTDAFVEMFGPISEVYAVTTSRVAYPENGDVISVLTRFESGATGYLNAILVTPHYLVYTVFGSKAWAEVRNDTHPDTPGPATLTIQHADGRREVREYQWLDSVRANLESFARAIAGRETYRFTDEQKIGNIAALEAITQSAASGQPVKVAPIGKAADKAA